MSQQYERIPFNKPFLAGKELEYIHAAVQSGKISGNGDYTQKCQDFFCQRFGFSKTLLTTSCTDALEMAAILANIQPGDEVIIPSYTFVSTANAFALRGAKIIFADSEKQTPNIDCSRLEELITHKTRALVAVHYAGVSCDMDALDRIARGANLMLIEDAAQAIDSYFKGKPLGSLGAFGAFSFHETKNIISGEGGALCINDASYHARAEIIWEKGTNRAAFWRGEVDKYGWVDIGSSFLPSEIIAAFLYAQLESLETIQVQRKTLWNTYNARLSPLVEIGVRLPYVPEYATNNAHMFYLICRSLDERSALIEHLKTFGVHAVFHYQSLHKSPYFSGRHDGRELPMSDLYTDRLLRLPLYYELTEEQVGLICDQIIRFYDRLRTK